jgi:hypothetical protein
MKIIQSFAQFEEGNPRLHYEDIDKKLLNFYSFLLSYLTINKYHGSVTMYCNQKALDNLIKYIPYDEVKIVENKNTTLFWSYYKVDIMKSQRQDFIHVDPDVFIFDDLFSPFINDNSCDMIIQNQIPRDSNYVHGYVDMFRDFIIENDIIDPDVYDNRCFSCGVVGMRHRHKNGYIKLCETMKKGFIKAKTEDAWFIGMANEELALYLYTIKNNFKFKIHNILPYEDVLRHTEKGAGNFHNYTHMYMDSKFQPKYVRLVRYKILKEFPEAMKYLERYENEVMMNSKLLDKIMV